MLTLAAASGAFFGHKLSLPLSWKKAKKGNHYNSSVRWMKHVFSTYLAISRGLFFLTSVCTRKQGGGFEKCYFDPLPDLILKAKWVRWRDEKIISATPLKEAWVKSFPCDVLKYILVITEDLNFHNVPLPLHVFMNFNKYFIQKKRLLAFILAQIFNWIDLYFLIKG